MDFDIDDITDGNETDDEERVMNIADLECETYVDSFSEKQFKER